MQAFFFAGHYCRAHPELLPEFSHNLGVYLRFRGTPGLLLRKEVIQPQVPLRLPCYDFIPVIDHTLGAFPLCRSDQRSRPGNVFKAS